MDKMQILSLILNAVLSVGFITAVATLRSTRRKAREEARRAAIENDKSLMDSFNQYILNPVLKEMEVLRGERERSREHDLKMQKLYEKTNRKLDRLARAIEKIPSCPHAADCPVRNELQNSKDDHADSDADNSER